MEDYVCVYYCINCEEDLEYDPTYLYKGNYYCEDCLLDKLQKDKVFEQVN